MLKRLSIACLTIASTLWITSCVSEQVDDPGTRATYLQLSLNMPLSNVDAPTGYENGNIYENGISNYQILFYTANTDEYICTLNSQTISATDTDQHTEYTITGKITDDEGNNPLEATGGNFKVVMIANWDYTLTSNELAGTTIAELCNIEKAKYYALSTDQLDLSKYERYLPYFGVHTYSDINLERNGTTYLPGALTLLRAVAKVEIIIANDSDGDDNITLASATLHHYNKTGYCAPKNVSSEDDYGQAKDWASDYTDGTMHLVNDANDREAASQDLELIKIQDRERDANGNITQKEKWIAYMPEYDNSGEDFAYISLKFDHALDEDDSKYIIYFAVYDEDGTSKAYTDDSEDEKAKRRSILRNNLYRYNVTVTQGKLRVFVDTWEDVFDNAWVFGNADPEEVGYQFSANGIEYEVLTSPAGNAKEGIDPDEDALLTIKTIRGTGDAYAGTVSIPSTVLYYGFTYTVTEIGEGSFDGHEGITAISIPATVTKIGDDAFEGCTILTSLYIHATTPPECGSDLFAQDHVENITLYVPYGVVTVYQNDETWGSFGFNAIEAIPD